MNSSKFSSRRWSARSIILFRKWGLRSWWCILNSWRRDGVNERKTWKEAFFNVNLCFLFDSCWFHLFPDSAQTIPPTAPSAQPEQKQTGLLWDLTQVPIAPHNAFATSLKPQISILAHADWRSGTSLVSGAATGLASITTKHSHNNKTNLSSFVFWSNEIKWTLQHVFCRENYFDIPSYVSDWSSLLKSKLTWWRMDQVPSETIVICSMDSKLPIWTHPHPQRER